MLFFRNGYHCPTAYNPADFLISVLSKTDPGEELNNVAQRLCDAFEASRADQSTQTAHNFAIEEDKQGEIQKPLWIFTIYWLIYRNMLIVARDPSIQKIRIVQKIVSESIFFSKLKVNELYFTIMKKTFYFKFVRFRLLPSCVDFVLWVRSI